MANYSIIFPYILSYIQELPEEAKDAATKLGYTKKMWDSDKGK